MKDKKLIERVYNYMKEKGYKAIYKKDIALYLKCQKIGDYTEIHKTKLYINHGGTYCHMLEVVNWFS